MVRASQVPVYSVPDSFEAGRQALHAQLLQTQQVESQAEKQNWNTSARLLDMLNGHQQRMERLTGNSQAGEIVAYDRNSIDRLQKRINDLAAQAELAEQRAAEAAEQQAESATP